MKVAVIGTGFGQYAAAPVYRKLGFDVEVVSPRDDAAVRRALTPGVDLVSVHSPPFMHFDHVMQAIDAGHAVLCDKPFGRNAGEARAMRDHARDRGVLHFTNYELRAKPSRAKIKELADAGAIGVPRHLSWTFFSNGFRGRPYGWINDGANGGGWIGAYASHLIDFTRWLFDSEVAGCGGITRIEDPTHVDADGVPRTATAEDAYSAWFVMANGCTAAQDSAYAAAVPMPQRIAVMGSAGSIELVADQKLIVRRAPDTAGLSAAEAIRRGVLPGEGDEILEFPPPAGEAHEPALIPWFGRVKEALETGQQIAPSFDDGLAVAEAMDQLRTNAIQVGLPDEVRPS
jgi:predicted dehydrogenase